MQANGEADKALAAGVRPSPALSPFDDGDDATFNRFSDRIVHTIARRVPFRTADLRLERPIVSFSFDDFPVSAHETGARILEDHDARGTFYAATGLLGQKRALWTIAGGDAIRDLHGNGHEIGLHTHSHRPSYLMDRRQFVADLAANRAALRRILPDLANETFAYPFGLSGLAQKRSLGRLARASRSVQRGLNIGRMDLDFIRAYELTDRGLSREELDRLLDETAARTGWLVFLTHDIAETPTRFGASPALLSAALEGAAKRGLDILPIRDALTRIGVS
jgi:peptidoglycan/xylan/chitin deacetylase (PgdA/CDA1 family)